MAIITLTTDFGERDPYAGAVKGAIYTEMPDIKIVDISHEVSPFHNMEAAYIIHSAYSSFPRGTVHIIGVDAEYHPENIHLAMLYDGHYFICADNGILSLLTEVKPPEKIVEINIHNHITTNFPVLEVFVKVATYLAGGGNLTVIGKEINNITTFKSQKAVVSKDSNLIVGNVIYIDNYGNAVANINRSLIDKVGQGRAFTVEFGKFTLHQVHKKYSDIVDFAKAKNERIDISGKEVVIYNSLGYLELAMYRSNPRTVGGASTMMGIRYNDQVSINFKDS